VSVVDLSSYEVVRAIPAGQVPDGMAFAPGA